MTNYDKMLKDITDATALQGVIDSVASELRSVEAAVANQRREIEIRKGLEESVETLETKRAGIAKTLEQHQAEMDKRMAELKKAGVTLPIDVKPTVVVHR